MHDSSKIVNPRSSRGQAIVSFQTNCVAGRKQMFCEECKLEVITWGTGPGSGRGNYCNSHFAGQCTVIEDERDIMRGRLVEVDGEEMNCVCGACGEKDQDCYCMED